MGRFNDKLNGKLLFEQFGCIVQTGTEDLLALAKRKETPSFDWPETHGEQRDLSRVHFNDNEIKLQLAIMADDEDEFWAHYNKLVSHLSKPGWQKLYIHDHEKTYMVSYVSSGGFKKAGKRLKNVAKIFVNFSVSFIVEFKPFTAIDRVNANLEDYNNITTVGENGFRAIHNDFRFHDNEAYKRKVQKYLSRFNSVIYEDKSSIEMTTGTGEHICLPDGFLNNQRFQTYVVKNNAPSVLTLFRALRSMRKKRVDVVVLVIGRGALTKVLLKARVNQAYEKYKEMFAYRYKEIIIVEKEMINAIPV